MLYIKLNLDFDKTKLSQYKEQYENFALRSK